MSEWQEVKLKHLTTKIGSGATPKGGQEVYHDSGISLIRSQNVLDFEFSNNGLAFIDEDQAQKLSNVVVEEGDILLNITGDSVARVCKVPPRFLPARVNQHVSIVRSDSQKIDSEFLLYFLLNPVFKNYLLRLASDGATRNALTKSDLEGLSILVPLLDEQESIAKILSCLDRKIENLRKQNETLEAIAQTLFKHWFIDFEFPNADGKPYKSSGGAMEPSELGKTPAGWRVGSLGDAVKVNAESIGKGYPHKNIEYVDISSVGVGVLEGTTSYQLKKAPSRARRLVKHGDVIWSGVRPNRKSYFFIAHPPGNLVVSTGFITLTPNLIPSSYLYSWVTTDSFVEYLTFNASGSAYPAVKAEHFEIANILLPDKLNLSRFHAVVDPMREKIQQNSQQIQTLTKTRDVLLPKLMSGKLRINP